MTIGSVSRPWLPSQNSERCSNSDTGCAAKKSGSDGAQRAFLGDRLGAVLAELRRPPPALRLGPRAARAVEATAVIEPAQRLRGADNAGLRDAAVQRHGDGGDTRRMVLWWCDGQVRFVDVGDGGVGANSYAHGVNSGPGSIAVRACLAEEFGWSGHRPQHRQDRQDAAVVVR